MVLHSRTGHHIAFSSDDRVRTCKFRCALCASGLKLLILFRRYDPPEKPGQTKSHRIENSMRPSHLRNRQRLAPQRNNHQRRKQKQQLNRPNPRNSHPREHS